MAPRQHTPNSVEGGLAASRARILRSHGASDSAAAELLRYNHNPFAAQLAGAEARFPLVDEPHVEAWAGYHREAGRVGVLAALCARLVQLRFPIEEGISKSDAYLAATRRGRLPDGGEGLELERPDLLELGLQTTAAGTIPILVAGERADFVALVRAFSARNEPVPVPDSMGACIVKGLNNWDRIAAHRRAWEAADGGGSWDEEFRRLLPRKELYQDRFILLSHGPYSAVPAARLGLTEEDWLERSLVLRREHECTHYLTLRILGMMRNNLLDELVADFAGLIAALGEYSAEAALLFFGLEDPDRFRASGRLANYRGDPPLSDDAFTVLQCLVREAVRNLARFDATESATGRDPAAPATVLLALAGSTLEELAAPEAVERLHGRVAAARPAARGGA